MPAFTFEKISPPVKRGPIAPIEQKRRGVIVTVLGKMVAARQQRAGAERVSLRQHRKALPK